MSEHDHPPDPGFETAPGHHFDDVHEQLHAPDPQSHDDESEPGETATASALDGDGDGDGDGKSTAGPTKKRRKFRLPVSRLGGRGAAPKLKRETRFGLAALLSFVILVTVLLINKRGKAKVHPESKGGLPTASAGEGKARGKAKDDPRGAARNPAVVMTIPPKGAPTEDSKETSATLEPTGSKPKPKPEPEPAQEGVVPPAEPLLPSSEPVAVAKGPEVPLPDEKLREVGNETVPFPASNPADPPLPAPVGTGGGPGAAAEPVLAAEPKEGESELPPPAVNRPLDGAAESAKAADAPSVPAPVAAAPAGSAPGAESDPSLPTQAPLPTGPDGGAGLAGPAEAMPPLPATTDAAAPPPTTTDAAAPPLTTTEAAAPPPTTTDAAAPPLTTTDPAAPPPTTTDAAAPPAASSAAEMKSELMVPGVEAAASPAPEGAPAPSPAEAQTPPAGAAPTENGLLGPAEAPAPGPVPAPAPAQPETPAPSPDPTQTLPQTPNTLDGPASTPPQTSLPAASEAAPAPAPMIPEPQPQPQPQPAAPPAADAAPTPTPTPAPAQTPAPEAAPAPSIGPGEVPNLDRVPASDESMNAPLAEPPRLKPGEGIPIPNAGKGKRLDAVFAADSAAAPAAALAAAGTAGAVGAVAAAATTGDSTEPDAEEAEAISLEQQLHVVERGENFWTISRQYYNSGRYYKALWKANSRTVSAPEQLMVGQTIVIPPPERLDRTQFLPPSMSRGTPASSSPTAPVRRTSNSRSNADQESNPAASEVDRGAEVELALPINNALVNERRALRASETLDPPLAKRPRPSLPRYRVRDGETLRGIARDTLGNSRRADEILELNAELLDGDSHNLVAGQILELPEDARVARASR